MDARKINRFYEPKRFDMQFEEDVLMFFVYFVIESFEKINLWQDQLKEKGVSVNTVVIFILDNLSALNEVDWRFY